MHTRQALYQLGYIPSRSFVYDVLVPDPTCELYFTEPIVIVFEIPYSLSDAVSHTGPAGTETPALRLVPGTWCPWTAPTGGGKLVFRVRLLGFSPVYQTPPSISSSICFGGKEQHLK